MKKIIVLLFLINSVFIYSQNDCSDALIVCGNSGYQDLNATGVGVQELSGSNTCGSQENNSLWLQVNINTGGKLGFVLTPTFSDGTTNSDLAIDFDFFIFGPFRGPNKKARARTPKKARKRNKPSITPKSPCGRRKRCIKELW